MGDADFPVVIIGGGLAGLTAAYKLASAGLPPLVLEGDSFWAGGRLSGGEQESFTYQGEEWAFRLDHGVHALWGEYRNMRALLDDLGIELRPSGGEEWIHRWGEDVRRFEAGSIIREMGLPAPFHYLQLLLRPRFWRLITVFDFLSLPGFLFSTLMALGIDPIREQAPLDGLGLDEFFRGWTPTLKATMVGLAANLLAAPPEQISLTGFIAALRFYTLLRRDSWVVDFLPGNSHDALVAPLMKRIRENEGEVLHGWEVTRIERAGGGWRIRADTDGGRRAVYAERIILALHPPATQRLIGESPDLEGGPDLLIPEAVKNATIRFWFSVDPGGKASSGMFTGDFLPDNFFWMHRLFPEHRPFSEATGGSVLEVHLYADEALLEGPERVLIARALQEIQRAWPILRGRLVHASLRVNSRQQPVLRVPDSESLHVGTPWGGVYACGDWIGYPHPSLWMERAVTTAIAASNAVLEAHGLPADPILDPRPPEPLARVLSRLMRLLRVLVWRPLRAGMRTLRR
jgi:isorenieratene synthase